MVPPAPACSDPDLADLICVRNRPAGISAETDPFEHSVCDSAEPPAVRAGIEDPEAAAEALEVEPAIPGIVPAQLQNIDPSTTPTGLDRELLQWQRFATNRAKRGEKVDQVFKCEHVPVTLQKSIIGQLETANNVRDVKEIFTAASSWKNYP